MSEEFDLKNYLTSQELIALIDSNLNLDYDMSEQQKTSLKGRLIERIIREEIRLENSLKKNPEQYNDDPEMVFIIKNKLFAIMCPIDNGFKDSENYSEYNVLYFRRPLYSIELPNDYRDLLFLIKKDKSEFLFRKVEYDKAYRNILKHEVYNNNNPFEATITIKDGFNIVNTLKQEVLEDVWEEFEEYDYYSVCNNLGRSRLVKKYSKSNILYTQTSNTGYKVYHSEKLKQIILSWDIETLTNCYCDADNTTKSIDRFNNYLESNDFKIVGKISCSIWRLMFCDNKMLEKYKADYNKSHVKVDINNCKVKMTAYAHTHARKEEHNFLPDKTINYNEYIVLDYGNL